MTEILAVFRSRLQAIDCLNRLKGNSISAGLINTPKEANIGCGLSVKFPANALSKVRGVVARANYSAFYGYFKLTNRYGKYYVIRINS